MEEWVDKLEWFIPNVKHAFVELFGWSVASGENCAHTFRLDSIKGNAIFIRELIAYNQRFTWSCRCCCNEHDVIRVRKRTNKIGAILVANAGNTKQWEWVLVIYTGIKGGARLFLKGAKGGERQGMGGGQILAMEVLLMNAWTISGAAVGGGKTRPGETAPHC